MQDFILTFTDEASAITALPQYPTEDQWGSNLVADPGDIEPIPAGGLMRPVVPESVSALQGLLAIDRAGFAGQYEAWANDPSRTFSERAFISKAETWRRDDPTLLNAATALGISKNQLDELFILAVTL